MKVKTMNKYKQLYSEGKAVPLLKELNKPLADLISTYVFTSDIRSSRTDQLSKAQTMELYYKGHQYLAEVGIGGGKTAMMPIDNLAVRDRLFKDIPKEEAPDIYSYNLNVVKGDLSKVAALLSKMEPNVTATRDPDDSDVPDNVLELANTVAKHVGNIWDRKQIIQLASMYYLKFDGPVFLHTPFVFDPEEYGVDYVKVPVMGMTKVEGGYICGACGETTRIGEELGGFDVPNCVNCSATLSPEDLQPEQEVSVVTGEEEVAIPRGLVNCFTKNITTTFISLKAKGIADSPYLFDEQLGHLGKLRQRFGRIFKEAYGGEIKAGTSGCFDSYAITTQQIMDAPYNRNYSSTDDCAVESNVWLDSAMFHLFPDNQKEITEFFLDTFPKGVKATFIQGKLVNLTVSNKSAEWVCLSAMETEKPMGRMAVMGPYIPAQDIINDILGTTENILASATNITFYDPDMIDPVVLQEASGKANPQFVAAKTNLTRALSQALETITPTQPNSSGVGFMQLVLQLTREIVGITPALFGGGSFKTAEEARIAREQSLQTFQPFYGLLRNSYCLAIYNGVIFTAELAGGIIPVKVIGGREVVAIQIANIQSLVIAGWRYFIDEAIPISPSEQRERVQVLIQQVPDLAQKLLAMPGNVSILRNFLGINELKLPETEPTEFVKMLLSKLAVGEEIPPIPPGTINPAYVQPIVDEWLFGKQGIALFNSNFLLWQKCSELPMMLNPPPPPLPEEGGPQGGPQGGEPPIDSGPPME